MRRGALLALGLLVACAPTPPAPPRPVPPAAPPRVAPRPTSRPATGFCVTPFPSTEDGGDAVDLIVGDATDLGREVAFCLRASSGHEVTAQCLSVDLEPGRYQAWRRRPAATDPDREDPRVKLLAGQVQVCPRPGKCRTFPLAAGATRVQAGLSESGALLAVLVGSGGDTGRTLSVVELASGRTRFTAPWGEPRRSYTYGRLQWLGEALVIHLDLHAGPDGQSHLVDLRSGARTTWIGGSKPINTYGGSAVRVGPERWAMLAHDDSEVVTHDLATGQVAYRIGLDRRPAGARESQYGYGVHALLPLPADRLVVIFGYPVPGQVEVYDARTGVRRALHRPPICPDAAREPPARPPLD